MAQHLLAQPSIVLLPPPRLLPAGAAARAPPSATAAASSASLCCAASELQGLCAGAATLIRRSRRKWSCQAVASRSAPSSPPPESVRLQPGAPELFFLQGSHRAQVVPRRDAQLFQQQQQQQQQQPAAAHHSGRGPGTRRHRGLSGTPAPIAGPELMRFIKSASTWQHLAIVLDRWRPQLNQLHICAMITHLAQIQRPHSSRQQQQQEHDHDDDDDVAADGALPQRRPQLVLPTHAGRTPAPVRGLAPPQQQQQQQQPSQELVLATLLQLMASDMHRVPFRQLSNCMWAVAKLPGHPPASWVTRCLGACSRALANAAAAGPSLQHHSSRGDAHPPRPQELASLLYAVSLRPEWLAHAGDARQGGAQAWLEQVLGGCLHAGLQHFGPQELSNVLLSAANLQQRRALAPSPRVRACLSQVLQHAAARAGQLNQQEVSNVMWAAGRLAGQPGLVGPTWASSQQGAAPPGAGAAAAAAAAAAGSLQQPRQAWAGGGSALIPPPAPADMRMLLARMEELYPSMPSRSAALSLLGVAWLGCRPPRAWLRQVLRSQLAAVRTSGPRQLTQLLTALAYLGMPPPSEWMRAWLRRAWDTLPTFWARQLASTAWALRRLRLRPPPAFGATLLLCCADQLVHFTPVELSTLAQALGDDEGQWRPDEAWLRLYVAVLHDKMPQLTGEQLSLVLCMLARVRHRPPQAWLAAAAQHQAAHFSRMRPRTLAMTAHSLAALGGVALPAQPWAQHLLAASAACMPSANVWDLSSTAWALAVMEVQPSAQWLRAFGARCDKLLSAQLAALSTLRLQQQQAGGTGAAAAAAAGRRAVFPAGSPGDDVALEDGMAAGAPPRGAAQLQGEGEGAAADEPQAALEGVSGGVGGDGLAALHVGLPAWCNSLAPSEAGVEALSTSRGGRLKHRARPVLNAQLWDVTSLTKTLWALVRMGYGPTHPLTRKLVVAARALQQLDEEKEEAGGGAEQRQSAAQRWHQWRQLLAETRAQAAAPTSLSVEEAARALAGGDEACGKQPRALAGASSAAAGGSAQAEGLDPDRVVLSGMVTWAAARFAADASAPPADAGSGAAAGALAAEGPSPTRRRGRPKGSRGAPAPREAGSPVPAPSSVQRHSRDEGEAQPSAVADAAPLLHLAAGAAERSGAHASPAVLVASM